jgi:hypothetical protein
LLSGCVGKIDEKEVETLGGLGKRSSDWIIRDFVRLGCLPDRGLKRPLYTCVCVRVHVCVCVVLGTEAFARPHFYAMPRTTVWLVAQSSWGMARASL